MMWNNSYNNTYYNNKEHINFYLLSFLKDLLFHRKVSFIQAFRIFRPPVNHNALSLKELVFALLTSFLSPSVPFCNGYYFRLQIGSFVLEEDSGLAFLVALQHKHYYYFFLFRSEIKLSSFAGYNEVVDKSLEPVFLHDRLASFQHFCECNNLVLESLFFNQCEKYDSQYNSRIIVKKPFFDYLPFHHDKYRSYVSFLLLLKNHILDQTQDAFQSCFFWVSLDNLSVIYSHPSLCFFSLSAFFQFEIVNRCKFEYENYSLRWETQPINITVVDSRINQWEYNTSLQVKPFSLFAEYCKSSQRTLVNPFGKEIVFQATPISIFNFHLWFDFAIRFGWYSVGGYVQLDAKEFVREIYNFMQYELLENNTHCAFSYFDNQKKRLYFWLLFNTEADFLQFKKKQRKCTYLVKERFTVEKFGLVDKFLKSYMYYYHINQDITGCCVCDFRTASYYVGLYSNDMHILSCLKAYIVDDHSLESGFFPTDTIKYTLSHVLFDTMSGDDCPITLLRQETGMEMDWDIWLFEKPSVGGYKVLDFRFDPYKVLPEVKLEDSEVQ